MSGPGVLPTTAIYAGDDWSAIFTVTRDGAAVDLATEGWGNPQMMWRPAAGSGMALTLTVDDSQASTGVLKVSATGTQTEQMGGSGVMDLQTTAPDGTVTTRLRGSTTWIQDVTR